jgi:hypothetical protein
MNCPENIGIKWKGLWSANLPPSFNDWAVESSPGYLSNLHQVIVIYNWVATRPGFAGCNAYTEVSAIIISLLMSPLLKHRPYGLHIRRTGHTPREPSADWWVLTTANAAGTHPMTDKRYLTSAIACRSALAAGPLSSSMVSLLHYAWYKHTSSSWITLLKAASKSVR